MGLRPRPGTFHGCASSVQCVGAGCDLPWRAWQPEHVSKGGALSTARKTSVGSSRQATRTLGPDARRLLTGSVVFVREYRRAPLSVIRENPPRLSRIPSP